METCTYIDAGLLEEAEAGRSGPFKDFPEFLDRLSPNKNTILHIYLSTLSERSKEFIKEVLSICPPLLLKVNVHGDTPLHIAARYGHADAAIALIEQAKASTLNEIDLESGEGPRESEMAAVRKMLRMTNKNKETALHEAARNERSLGVVEAIMSNEDPREFTYSANNRGETPLYLAVKNRNGWIACKLLFHPDSELLAYGGPNGKTALHEATVLDFADDDFTNKGLTEQLREKLNSLSRQENVRDNAQSSIGLMEQLWKKFKQLWKKFKSLLGKKNVTDGAQLLIDTNSRLTEHLRMMLNYLSPKENVKDDVQSLIKLTEQRREKFNSLLRQENVKDDVQSLIGLREQLKEKLNSLSRQKGVTDDEQSIISTATESLLQLALWTALWTMRIKNDKYDGESPIERFIQIMLTSVMRLTKETDEKGWTPLHYAAYTRKQSAVEFLLDSDISSAYIADKEGKRTALHIAACRGFQCGMEKIISVCPTCCEITDIRGWNVIHYAVISQNDEVLKAVLQKSSLIYLLNEKDDQGNTPVHLYQACHPRLPSFIQHGDTDMFKHWKTLHKQIQNERDFPLKKVSQLTSYHYIDRYYLMVLLKAKYRMH